MPAPGLETKMLSRCCCGTAQTPRLPCRLSWEQPPGEIPISSRSCSMQVALSTRSFPMRRLSAGLCSTAMRTVQLCWCRRGHGSSKPTRSWCYEGRKEGECGSFWRPSPRQILIEQQTVWCRRVVPRLAAFSEALCFATVCCRVLARMCLRCVSNDVKVCCVMQTHATRLLLLLPRTAHLQDFSACGAHVQERAFRMSFWVAPWLPKPAARSCKQHFHALQMLSAALNGTKATCVAR
mmetsp:Transcript_40537/g.83016  ORF Transcript_40537/g.83016 Transcript_40537/m.83016 type:complete len:237 (+) Transcript_40537:229-939(+)